MTTIHARITLLTLTTVMFGLVWSHDHKPVVKQKTVVAYDFEWPCAVKVVEPAIQMISWEQIDHEVMPLSVDIKSLALSPLDQSLDVIQEQTPALIKVSLLAHPLPHDIAVGEYRVVDQFGDVQSLSVTAENLRMWGISESNVPQNSYEIQSDNRRWHLIRIEEPEVMIVEDHKPSDLEMEAAWGSVLSFAGGALNPAVQSVTSPLKTWLGEETQLSSGPIELN